MARGISGCALQRRGPVKRGKPALEEKAFAFSSRWLTRASRTIAALIVGASAAASCQDGSQEGLDEAEAKSIPVGYSLIASFGAEDHPFEQTIGDATDVALAPDGATLLLDARNHRVVALDATGRRVATYERPGRGPGELYLPVAIAYGDSGTLYVLDRGTRRVLTLQRTSSSLEHVSEFRYPHDGRDICIMDDRIVIAGDYQHRVLHFYTLDGVHQESTGEFSGAPLTHPTDHPLYEKHFGTGVLGCDHRHRRIYFASRLHGVLRAFDAHGVEIYQQRLPRFVHLMITQNERGGLRNSYPDETGWYHRVANLVIDSAGGIIVQVVVEQKGQPRRPERSYVDYYVQPDGRGSIVGPVPNPFGSPYYVSDRSVVTVGADPFPVLRLLRFSSSSGRASED